MSFSNPRWRTGAVLRFSPTSRATSTEVPAWARGRRCCTRSSPTGSIAPPPGQNRTPDGNPLKRWGTIPKGHELYGNVSRASKRGSPYIASLGIDTVRASTPIFRSKSAHRYDTDDYFEIDRPSSSQARSQGSCRYDARCRHAGADPRCRLQSFQPQLLRVPDVIAHGEASGTVTGSISRTSPWT